MTAFALCGGSALYLLMYTAIRSRVEGRLSLSRGRFVAAVALLLLLPVALIVPALAALAIVTEDCLLHGFLSRRNRRRVDASPRPKPAVCRQKSA